MHMALKSFLYDYRLFIRKNMNSATSPKGEVARIIAMYHALEKGITMPNRRLGFGQQLVMDLSQKIIDYRKKFGDCESCHHAEAVLSEYYQIHKDANYTFNEDIAKTLQKHSVSPSSQLKMTDCQFWANRNSDFANFSNSRHCVRDYSPEPISIDSLKAAVSLANNAPSACNRQPCKVYYVEDADKKEKMLQMQCGNRGFGHLADKVLVLTCDRSAFMQNEAASVYVNGGIYLMNLAYALHYHQIAHCILTWVPPPKQDKLAHKLLGIDEGEAIIALFTCGTAPKEFMLASSPRKDLDATFVTLK